MAEEERAPTGEGLPEEEFSRLLQSVSTMAPLLKSFFPKDAPPPHDLGHKDGADGGHRGGCVRREALLLALKPYLSPARCEAVDYFIRLARVGDAIRALQ